MIAPPQKTRAQQCAAPICSKEETDLFCIGQYVIYGQHGVCRVVAIGPLDFSRDKGAEYYTLQPLHDANGTKFYVPTRTAAGMRPVITSDDAYANLAHLQQMDVQICRSTKCSVLTRHYQDLIEGQDLAGYLQLYKEICHKEQWLDACGKKLGQVDRRFGELAERMLCDEFSVALRESPAASKDRLHSAACA